MNPSELKRAVALATILRNDAMKNYNKFAELYIRITNKKGQAVQLKQNYVQRTIQAKIEELKSKSIPPRLIVLKSRQMGVSTDIQGRMIYETTTKENRNGYIVSHEVPSTSTIFAKAKYMYDNLPDGVKPLQKASNATELIFDKPIHYDGKLNGLHSKIEIKTAGKAGIGRSETRHYVHLSEYAFWEGSDENAPDKQLSGILQSVPDDPDTWVIIESTAKGFNNFKELWDKAVSGEIGFIPMFFPWFVHEEYTIPLEPGEERTFIQTMSDYEKYLYNELKLPLDRIKWWRDTKKNKCNNDINQMKQENPTTPEEAFIFSGTPVFDTDIIQKRIEYLRQKQPQKRGCFYFEWKSPQHRDVIKQKTIQFVDDPKGYITIYEEPTNSDMPYVIGGDTKGEGSDYFAATVRNNVTGNRAAVLHGQIDPDTYTHQVYCLGKYYNEALIGIEINFDIYPVKELERLGYPNQYMRQHIDSYTDEVQKKNGWKTDGITRPLIISKEKVMLRDHINLFNNIPMLQECLTFVYDKETRPDAMTGKHDDILFSDMITNEISSQQAMTANFPAPSVQGSQARRQAGSQMERLFIRQF
jgi:hypothetical protein